MSRFNTARLVLTCLCVAAATSVCLAFTSTDVFTLASGTINLAELPKQGVQTYVLIHQGEPFASEKDGVVFGNRERLLPAKKRGYYLEYTVKTPGLNHRGVKRIVCGGARTKPDVCYYTADHYASFRKIVQ